MKRLAVRLASLLFISSTCPAGFAQEKEGFSFSSDLGGKRLESLLRPGEMEAKALVRTAPLPRPAPQFLENPQIYVGTTRLLPSRPKLPSQRITMPLHPQEAMPLASFLRTPEFPRPLTLPAGELAYWPSVPVQQVPLLPILGAAKPDRSIQVDPTLEASLAVTLRVLSLARTGTVPFSPVNLPDPFELRQRVELRDPPQESSMPPAFPFPRIPAK